MQDKPTKDKMLKGAPKQKAEALEEYFFAGGLEYLPMTIKAKDQQEAIEIWESKRVKVVQ